ncbi:MAG: hypothetical protein KF812_06940 [Fimbriimonadaceae bacterium]|nr:hypothetical protein [Fimbriimonadaceae bacterium]
MEDGCRSQAEALAQLDRVAPGVPLLALGQTIFWDEPMKAGVALTAAAKSPGRRFIAGVHDTDYFAKAPGTAKVSGYAALPHNDTTTQALWSAAAEFSTLFGSETVVTRDRLAEAGASLSRLQSGRPGLMEEITEAWGWRGLVNGSDDDRVTFETPLGPVFPALYNTLEWAVDSSVAAMTGKRHKAAREEGDELLTMVCDAAEDRSTSLATLYEKMLPGLYRWIAARPVSIETTRTSELLAFTPENAALPRFRVVNLFINPETRARAEAAYDTALRGTEMYTLDRFGTGALPFDLIVPGRGRGTLRLGTRGLVINTPTPIGIGFKNPPKDAIELATILRQHLGDGLVLVGKAVSLIAMLGQEYVFVFHEGASSYVSRTRRFLLNLSELGLPLNVHPILRVQYDAWAALNHVEAWFRLPEPLRGPFGTDELSGTGFAARLPAVAERQKNLLRELGKLRRPRDLMAWLAAKVDPAWECALATVEAAQSAMLGVKSEIEELRMTKRRIVEQVRELRAERSRLEKEKGKHWRERIFNDGDFGQNGEFASSEDWAHREQFASAIKRTFDDERKLWAKWRREQSRLDEIVSQPTLMEARRVRDEIAFEAELARVRLIREAIVATDGLDHASHRPAAWWFPLVCPDGTWFEATHATAKYRLEPLT